MSLIIVWEIVLLCCLILLPGWSLENKYLNFLDVVEFTIDDGFFMTSISLNTSDKRIGKSTKFTLKVQNKVAILPYIFLFTKSEIHGLIIAIQMNRSSISQQLSSFSKRTQQITKLYTLVI